MLVLSIDYLLNNQSFYLFHFCFLENNRENLENNRSLYYSNDLYWLLYLDEKTFLICPIFFLERTFLLWANDMPSFKLI